MVWYDSAGSLSLKHFPQRMALFLCWTFGLGCGVFLFLYAGTPFVSLMRRTLLGSVSIVSLFSVGLIPFLFTVYAVSISKLRLIFPICFWKACLFAYVSMGIFAAFSSAGWLMHGLLLFSGSIWCVLMYFLWIRLLSGRKVCWFAVIAAGLLTGSIAYYIITPMLAGLIEIKKG